MLSISALKRTPWGTRTRPAGGVPVGGQRALAGCPESGDAGFTMIEMLVAMLVMSIIMIALTTFFVSTISASTRQGASQIAAQLGDDAIEHARALQGSAVVSGRDQTSSTSQWNNPVSGIAPYLADMQETYDPTAAVNAGPTASLPTSYRSATVNNQVYKQNFYVGACWQPTSGGSCGASKLTGYVAFYRVVVAVIWTDKACNASTCSYITTTLISGDASEPIFLVNGAAQPPAITNPGAQGSDKNVADSLQMVASGGAPPLVWSTGTTLPTGLSINPSTGLISGTPTATGTSNVVVSATDGFGLIGSAAFTWTVNAAPTVTLTATPSYAGAASTLALTTANGTGSFTFTATGLPAGVSMDSSGNFSGSPTTAGTYSVKVTVVDAAGGTNSSTASWVVSWQPLTVTNPGSWNSQAGSAIPTLKMVATGGSGTYAWAATGLPSGVSIAPTTGYITGTPSAGGPFTVKVTATDATASLNSSAQFTWSIGGALQVTAPANQTSDTGQAITAVQVVGSGGDTAYSWSASNLPAGLSIDPVSGIISGTPTNVASAKTVTVTLVDGAGTQRTASFTWTINAPVKITSPATTQTNTHNQNITSITATATGGGSISWSAGGTLPTGISITSAGLISGKPTVTGTYTVTITATDAAGNTATSTFSWKIT